MSGAEDQASTVFVVDDDESVCEAICNLLDSMGIASKHFGSCEEFLDQWNSESPGCLVLDVQLPGMTGVELQEKLLRLRNQIPIIFVTAHGDVPMVRKVMKAGAYEFLTKPFLKEELLDAVQQAFALNRTWRHKETLRRLLQARFDSLKERERQIMLLVTDGSLNKQIAAKLNMSEISVKVYRRQVMEKMQANSVAELAKMAEELRQAAALLK